MKNRVREHGDKWTVCDRDACGGLNQLLLITPAPHGLEKEPYMIWVTPGKDITVTEEEGAPCSK